MQIQIKKIYYNGLKHLKNMKSNNFYNIFLVMTFIIHQLHLINKED